MRKQWISVVLILGVFAANSYGGWVEDKEFGFKINVPDNWKRSILNDGSDRIHVFLSPDENVAVRIRAFKVPAEATVDLIIPLFEKNVLSGGERKALMDHSLNGSSGKVGAYTGSFNGTAVGAGAYFTIHNGIAYVVWSLTPVSMFQSRYAESDAITNTFTLVSNNSQMGSSLPSLKDTGSGNLFRSAELGYSIRYPAEWVYAQPKPHILIISGREGTPAYYATVNIQNLAATSFGGQFSNINEVLNYFQKQLFNGASDITMTQSSAYSLSSGGGAFTGKQIEMTYQRQGTRFKQWLIVVPRHDQKVFYAFSYTASIDDFPKYLGAANQMLNNWTIE